MARLELDSVTKRFGEGDGSVLAVDDVSIDIPDGEFLVLVGPSGCGKSTTLRMVAGLERITDGEIRLDDERINEQGPAERDIAMVFQSYALYPHMTVRENMRFGLEESTDLAGDEMDERVESTAAMLDITELLDRKPGALSGGQQQRVALGRAIVREPKAFLMDEPLSNLDAKLRSQMRTELQQLQADLDTTTVYVTHDQTEAMTMSDRIVILDGGEIQQVGTPEEVYANPANLFVADFIGSPSMNFATVALEGNRFVSEDFEYEISPTVADEIRDGATGDRLELGIRPEHIQLSTDNDHNSIPVTLDVLEHEGSDNYLYVVSDTIEWTVRVPGDERYDSGQELNVSIPERYMHVFDAETGENLLVDTSGSEVEHAVADRQRTTS